MLTLYKHTLVPDLPGLAEKIGKVKTVLDIGAGIRPAMWVNAENHICVEPCHVYAEILRANGMDVIEDTAFNALHEDVKADLILMLDVIEHMDRQEAESVLEMAKQVSPRIIVYAPHGFVEQTVDAWGLGQHEWQRHRSGWMPQQFPGWDIIEGKEGFAAIYGDVGQ